MKKISLFILAYSLTTNVAFSQISIDFESLPLLPDTFWDGSDLTGDFIIQNTIFPNEYDTSYQFWSSGWSYSNRLDSSTTPVDFSNYSHFLHNSKAGSGVNLSSNYIIGTQESFILLDSTHNRPKGVFVTNTTYAYNSMKLGDGFAKKFGGPSGSDPDYFKLLIRGIKNDTLLPDSAFIYLADFRNPDNTQDYILRDWVFVPLDHIGTCDQLTFELFSSDNGAFGMNTPAYFALDLIQFDQTSALIEAYNRVGKVYPNPCSQQLHIDKNFESYEIYTISGQKIMQGNFEKTIDIQTIPSGYYLLKIKDENTQISYPWIKN